MRKKVKGRPIKREVNWGLVEELLNEGMTISKIEDEQGLYRGAISKKIGEDKAYVRKTHVEPNDSYRPPKDF